MDKFIIAITRTCGSGATSIGKILAKNLGVEIYDRNILRLASDDSGISEELFARADEDQKQSILFRASQKVYSGGLIPPEKEDFTSNNNLFNYQAKVLRELADESNYVLPAARRIMCSAISRDWFVYTFTRPGKNASRKR